MPYVYRFYSPKVYIEKMNELVDSLRRFGLLYYDVASCQSCDPAVISAHAQTHICTQNMGRGFDIHVLFQLYNTGGSKAKVRQSEVVTTVLKD